MTAFTDLHVPGAPLFLPNAWDHASAATFAAAGFPAVGTTSLGVAAALGLPDGAAETADATVDLVSAWPTCPSTSPPTSRTASAPTRARSPSTSRGSVRRRRQPRGPARRPQLHAAVIAAVAGGERSSTPASTRTGPAARRSTRRSSAPRPTSTPAQTGSSSPASRTSARSPPSRRRSRPAERPVRHDRRPAPGRARRRPHQHRLAALPHRARRRDRDATEVSDGGRDFDAPSYAAVDALGFVESSARARRARHPVPVRHRVSSVLEPNVPAMCGRKPPSSTSGVMCSPRSYPEGRTKM